MSFDQFVKRVNHYCISVAIKQAADEHHLDFLDRTQDALIWAKKLNMDFDRGGLRKDTVNFYFSKEAEATHFKLVWG